jgi:DNA modification methylase
LQQWGLGEALPMKLEKIKISELSCDPANARKHPDRNIETIVASLKRFGQQKPIVIDSSNVVRAGNGTLEAARSMGWTEIDCVRTALKGSDAIAYAIADNRTAELAEWDDDVLAASLNGLLADDPDLLNAAGFSDEELAALLGDLDGDGTTGEVEEDEVPEVPVEPITKPGDLWILGKHRLLCGDSTKDSDVELLLNGDKINIAFTSPPYASQREYDPSSGFKPIPPDSFVEWFKPIAESVKKRLHPDGSWFVNIKPACEGLERLLYVFDLVLAHKRSWGWKFAEEFCWERTGIPQQVVRRFKNQFEPVYQFVLGDWKIRPQSVMHESESVPVPRGKGAGDTNAAKRQGVASAVEGNEIASGMAYPGNRLPKFQSEALGHSAAFPVGLPSFFIKAFSDAGDTVYEPFCGSGTTLIAAEQLSRKCYGMEISPQYCDVIVKRWENLTGEKAVCHSATHD